MFANESFSEAIFTRVTPSQKAALEEIAMTSTLTRSISDHVRAAIDEYIKRHQPEQESDHVAA